MNGKETFMVETLTRELIVRLMEEQSLPMRKAMGIVYNSKTYAALNNLNTGLYFQSPAYIYDILEQELKTNYTEKQKTVKRRKFHEYAKEKRSKQNAPLMRATCLFSGIFLRPHCEQVCPQFFIGRRDRI